MKSIYCSKILLFGEYSVIQNSMALAIPYNLFEGSLMFSNKYGVNTGYADMELLSFARFLKKFRKEELFSSFDFDSFIFDIGQGLVFNSTIPQGFGLGSSGALCAAVFDRYFQEKTTNKEILRKIFSLMESCFHGASSGLDPLISYLNKAILIKEKNVLHEISIPSIGTGKGGLFLVNTGRPRKTEPLVNLFLEKLKNVHFKRLFNANFIPVTNHCVYSFLEKNSRELWNYFYELSLFQRDHFYPMIPSLFRDLWEEGLSSKEYSLKLCGAGGGGFLLGMTRNFSRTSAILNPYEIKPLFRYPDETVF